MAVVYGDLRPFADQPSQSLNGHAMKLMGNLEFVEEISLAKDVGVDGVGLFRTEFMFLNADVVPDEEQQYQQYVRVVRGMDGKMVVFRLLDIGGDKPALFEQLSGRRYGGENPAMGLRGVRLLLQWPEVLEMQLAAMLRAAEEGPIQVLIPMVTACEEVERVSEMIEQICMVRGLDANVEVGAMIEVPAAAMIADDLAKCCGMFSVGTNDLIQYTLAADRSDEEVGSLYHSGHPAILSLLKQTVRAAKGAGIPVAVCGELASDPEWTETFLNLGMDALSMSLSNILPIRKHLSKLVYQPEKF
jgi:phosphotransferase system enzyme I (PtsI)